MVKALTVSISVLAGVLIGRIQIIENHEANDAIASSERMNQRFVAAKRDAARTHTLLDRTERKFVDMVRRIEPMLADFTQAETLIQREHARRRIQSLQLEMQTFDATITAAREASGEDARTAMRQAFVKANFGD